VLGYRAVEHRHHCVYCQTFWFCHEDCPLTGASACATCREKLRRSPDMPRRVIALDEGSQVLDRLAQHEGERLRRLLRKLRPR
jgi:hypothetical protein